MTELLLLLRLVHLLGMLSVRHLLLRRRAERQRRMGRVLLVMVVVVRTSLKLVNERS